MPASRMKSTDATSLPISSNSPESSCVVKPTSFRASMPAGRKMRSATDRYEARCARHTLLPLTKLDEFDKTFQSHFRFRLIRVSTVDLVLSPHDGPQHLREPGAQQGSRDCHLARKRFRNEDSGGVGFTIIRFP